MVCCAVDDTVSLRCADDVSGKIYIRYISVLADTNNGLYYEREEQSRNSLLLLS